METMTMDTTMRMITGKMHGIDNKEMKGYRYMKRKMNFRERRTKIFDTMEVDSALILFQESSFM